MRIAKRMSKSLAAICALMLFAAWLPRTLSAQEPPHFPPEQLDHLVARIALYPDPLLAQILAASTYPNDIPDAARWSDEHHYLRGDSLAAAINLGVLLATSDIKCSFSEYPVLVIITTLPLPQSGNQY